MTWALLLPPLVGYLVWERVQGPGQRDALECVGMALPLGAGITVVLGLALAPVGVGLAGGPLLAFLALSVVALFVLRPDAGPRRAPSAPLPGWLAAACAVVVAAQLSLVCASVLREGRLSDWDGWAIWGMKARAFFVDGGVDAYLARSDELQFSWPSRPALTALFQAFVYTCLGRVSESGARFFHVLLYASLLLLLFALLRGRRGGAAAAVGIALVATLPNLAYHASSGVANLALGAYVLALLVALERGLQGGGIGAPATAGLLAGFAALTRDEGRWLAGIAVLASLAVGAAQGRPRARLAAVAAVVAGVAAVVYAPWAAAVARSGASGLLSVWSAGDTLARVGAHLQDAPAVLRMLSAELLLPVEQTRASPFEETLGIALFWPTFGAALLALPSAARRDPLAASAALTAVVGLAFYGVGLWLFPYTDLGDLQHHWVYVLDRHLVSVVPAAAYAVVSALASDPRPAHSASPNAASVPASVSQAPRATERGA